MDNGKYQLALDKSEEVFVDDLCDGTLSVLTICLDASTIIGS